MLVEKHFRETEALLREVPAEDIALWLLNEGFFPEQYILPPSFRASRFELGTVPYNRDLSSLTRRRLINISYPKSLLTSRIFGIQHPWNFHDIVFFLKEEWDLVLDHLFHHDIRVYSYSLPIPVSKKKSVGLTKLRSGRMIYEWLAMAEKDLVVDAGNYQFFARTDITNLYASIYTHSIGWALHGREVALADKDCNLLGNKIDKLIQYANDARTNGIPVGSALSDLIAEIILAGMDRRVSEELDGVDFLAVRFKDDYRILCQDEGSAKNVLKVISSQLSAYNLSINENKTAIQSLPDGLYRKHDREYFPHTLREKKTISFKVFEHTLLIALDIHRNNPGTSILEKFVSEIFTYSKVLKIQFSRFSRERGREIEKVIGLLFLAKRESEKLLCHVLSVSEQLFVNHRKEYPELKEYLKSTIESEISRASKKGSVFEIVWLVFFARYIGLGITNFNSLIDDDSVKENEFYKSILTSQQRIFADSGVKLFKKPRDCRGVTLAKYLAVFSK